MIKSKVFFTDLRTRQDLNILQKLEKLIKTAGIEKIDFKNKLTALKIHFGEPGNLAFIRPNYVRKIADIIKELGGKPFLTDTNCLYMGERSNAVQHLAVAIENGFNALSTGVNVVIADGLRGSDFREIKVGGKHFESAKIGSAIADSDIIVSINHFKGHDMTGFGGALKNLGMGCGSKGGKLEMHSTSKPIIEKDKCKSCGACAKSCVRKAITFDVNNKASIDHSECIGCGQCIAMCMYESVNLNWDEEFSVLNEKISEYALAASKDKPSFHINFMIDISPNCDCWSNNDLPIVPDIGIAASFDPVALDKMCVDMVNKAPAIGNSVLGREKSNHGTSECDKFSMIYPNTNWLAGLLYSQSIGLGNIDYEIVDVE